MMLRTIVAMGALFVGTAAAQKNDWLIVPGQRVGPITAATTRADLDTLFGKDNVRDGSLHGSDVPEAATIVLGNDTSAALAVTWDRERAVDHSHLFWHADRSVSVAHGEWHQDWPPASGIGEAQREVFPALRLRFRRRRIGYFVAARDAGGRPDRVRAPGGAPDSGSRVGRAAALRSRSRACSSNCRETNRFLIDLSLLNLNPIVSALELQFTGTGCGAK